LAVPERRTARPRLARGEAVFALPFGYVQEQDKPRNYTGEAAEYGRGEAMPLKVPFVHLQRSGSGSLTSSGLDLLWAMSLPHAVGPAVTKLTSMASLLFRLRGRSPQRPLVVGQVAPANALIAPYCSRPPSLDVTAY
jgi:hypothetical protein